MEETQEKQKNRKRREYARGTGKRRAAIAAVSVLLAAAAGFYFYKSLSYRDTFLPGTYLNGQPVAGMHAEEAKDLIRESVAGYQLALKLRGGETETLTGTDIGLYAVFDESLERVIGEQNPYAWPMGFFKEVDYTLAAMVDFDKQKLKDALEAMPCFDKEKTEAPRDASISEYREGEGYVILPESEGNRIETEAAAETVGNAVKGLRAEISLEEEGLYEEPWIRQDNEALIQAVAELNRLAGTRVTYRFGDKKEVLDGNRIQEWLSLSDNQVVLDQAAVADYVEELADAYDTDHNAKRLKTSYGQTVRITGGSYGWRINQAKETQELTAIIESGKTVEREPVYSQKAASRGENDYGDTYVEINLTAQHLFYYVDGELLVESDFVSGNLAKGYGTPAGAYSIAYTQRNATLRGEGYATPVDYWMPFNGGIGLHDASWRSSFGGTIYKNGGSHGCVNLPPAVAKKIFENIEAGVPVLCYNLEGTEDNSAEQAAREAAEKAAAEQAAREAAEKAAAEQAAREAAEKAAAGQSDRWESQEAEKQAAQIQESGEAPAIGPEPATPNASEPAPSPAPSAPGAEPGPSPAGGGPGEPGSSGPGAKSEEKGPGV